MKRPVVLLLGCAVGCGQDLSSYFPLELGNAWSYEVKTDFDSRVDDLKVTSTAPVGNVQGYEISGPTGPTRLGWNGDTLLAASISGQYFDPPIPILSSKALRWQGTVRLAGRPTSASAVLECKDTVEKIAGRDQRAIQAQLTLKSTGTTVSLTTWFVRGIGIYRQEQRSGDRRERRIEYLSGP